MWEMLSYPFFQSALIAGTLSAALCALVGVYVLLKRIVFVGITLAQVASMGVAMALLIDVHPMITALVTTLAGVACFAYTSAGQRVPQEGVIGASYVMAAALGIIFVAKNPVGEARNLKVLFGNILSAHTGEMVALAVLLAVLAIVHVLFYKEFLFVSFDPETAQAQGINVRGWDLLLYLTIGLAIAFSIHSMGVLLVFALLLVPAMTARLLAQRMMALFTLAIGFGVISVPLGLYLAVRIDLPTGTRGGRHVCGHAACRFNGPRPVSQRRAFGGGVCCVDAGAQFGDAWPRSSPGRGRRKAVAGASAGSQRPAAKPGGPATAAAGCSAAQP